MEDLVYKYVLQNAVKYEGKANIGSAIGKIISENPDLKNDMKSLSSIVSKLVKKVNSMKVEEQIKELENIAPELLHEKKKVEERRLPELPNVKDKVVLRIAPNPNGPLHIGHARMIILNDEYTKLYDGKLILRFDDTDPKNENKKPMKEAYGWAEHDLKWLNVNYSRVERASARLEKYYNFFEQLISKDMAYVCTCEQEAWSELVRTKRKACPCRSLSTNENAKRWQDMLSGKYKEGEAVGRLKTSIYEDDPALVDWPTFRIVEQEHPLEKRFKVWPMLDFASAYDDHDFGVTHILRGKDLLASEFKQKILYNYLKWNYPETLVYGKFVTSEEMIISKSKIAQGIKDGIFTGYDDPRLALLRAFKRRGIQPKAIRNYILSLGVTQHETSVDLDILFAENRKLIDGNEFYVSKTDFERMEDGKLNRLMDCCNFIKKGNTFTFDSLEYEKFKDVKNKGLTLHYVSAENNVNVKVVMDDGSIVKGLGESTLVNLKVNDLIQAERRFFCKLDKIENDVYEFWFTH